MRQVGTSLARTDGKCGRWALLAGHGPDVSRRPPSAVCVSQRAGVARAVDAFGVVVLQVRDGGEAELRV